MIIPILLAAATPACIATVHDGDTIRLCSREKIRIANIDAPEVRGSQRCERRHLRRGKNPSWCDYRRGVEARDALAAFLRAGPVMVRLQGRDAQGRLLASCRGRNRRLARCRDHDYYGRTLATLTVNNRDAGRYLIGLGLARRWVR